jgi:hypothetical protein
MTTIVLATVPVVILVDPSPATNACSNEISKSVGIFTCKTRQQFNVMLVELPWHPSISFSLPLHNYPWSIEHLPLMIPNGIEPVFPNNQVFSGCIFSYSLLAVA